LGAELCCEPLISMFGSGSEESGQCGFSDGVVGGVVISIGFCSTDFATNEPFLSQSGQLYQPLEL